MFLDVCSVDKAIQFIQAEKMYYETALIDIAAFHKNLGELIIIVTFFML